ncbi:MAG: TIR domain-containing protein [Saprospiraceae bacterium]|nr:TIR domain-containing protein [Saprospiraceae bacterium]
MLRDKSPGQIALGEELYRAFPFIVQKPIEVDLADKDFDVFRRLKQTVSFQFSQLDVLGKSFPAFWTQIREELSSLKDERITWQQYKEICESNGMTDEASMKIWAKTLHNLGVLLYYPEIFGLENLIILEPQWCVDAIYRALDTESIIKNDGKFKENILAECWNKDERFQGNSLQLLKLMQQFDMCYLVDGTKDEYIAPQLLPFEEKRRPGVSTKNAIYFCLQYTFMPAGILTNLIARMSRHILSKYVWRRGVTLQWEEEALAEIIEDPLLKQINIKVVGPERQRRLDEIRKALLNIHAKFQGLKHEELVACNCIDCADKAGATMFKLKDLENYKKLDANMVCEKGTLKKIDPTQILEGLDFPDTPRIFISYSHKNEKFKDEFRTMIRPLERNGWKVWDDRYILPGDDWNDEILRHLSEANVIVLMLTADFFKSNFIYDIEFSRAIQRHESGDALMIGIVVDDCMYEETPLRKIQVLPKDAQPVVRHPHRSKVWKAVANKIKETIVAREERSQRRGW